MKIPLDSRRVSKIRGLSGCACQDFKGLRVRTVARKPFLGDVSVLHLRLPARRSLPMVQHERTAELIYVLKGRMTAVLGRSTRRLREGDSVFIAPGTWHKFTTAGSPCEALAIFNPELLIRKGADIRTPPGVDLWS